MVDPVARIAEEFNLLRVRYSEAEYRPDGRWVRIPDFELPTGWAPRKSDLVFQLRDGYPITCPYGFYIRSGSTFCGASPCNNAQDPAPQAPPHFGGTWAFFSGEPEDWKADLDPTTGSNLQTWVLAITQRLKEGA